MRGQWLRELGMGVRFAATGGRSGWTRTLLTAVGVGFGVAVLLLAASVPTALQNAEARKDARQPDNVFSGSVEPAGPGTLLMEWGNTTYRDLGIYGKHVQADGDPADAVRPPGVARLPRPGEMVVSPALRELLDSSEGALLAERFGDARIVGTIAPEGLKGPGELAYYLGADNLDTSKGWRVTGFGSTGGERPLDAALVLLLVVMITVFLAPIVVFIATAVRFGGERRDQRLAALRLVGADVSMTRRVAAGEVLFGTLLGVVTGFALFLAGRQLAEHVTISQISVYAADLTPVWWLTLLVMTAVPVVAIVVTVAALHGVSIGPLGVFRAGTTRRRRVWWRGTALVLGVAVLLYFGSTVRDGRVNQWGVAAGVLLMLAGVTALLPWAVERVVSRMNGGPLAWQLATRRLQLNSGMAARAVSGVTVAVAGAVALHMLFSAVEVQQTKEVGRESLRDRVEASADIEDAAEFEPFVQRYARTEGVESAYGWLGSYATVDAEPDANGYLPGTGVRVADCRTLRELFAVGTCADGDAFLVESPHVPEADVRPGDRLNLAEIPEEPDGPRPEPVWWTVPEDARTLSDTYAEAGYFVGVVATPGALDASRLAELSAGAVLETAPGDADALEHVRNTAGLREFQERAQPLGGTVFTSEFVTIRNALFVGALVVMLVIAASMVVSTLEQLRERRRQLSVLVAFGTRRGTLGASVLWQTAVPVVLGLVLASAGGTGLGVLLLDMLGAQVTDWLAFLPLAGAGLGMIVLVTLASLPMLWRLMRPDGLRTE
ncbi:MULTISPECIES: FtsX-like permease family protein [Streptomyces]|uniref:FtsX-like permease family protein n=1 Tax=Streptomyces TaxID=1883 RepID=UPI002248A9E0|nr:FtsX-like permease family protein [Streptomyces sp. JHD 1]MCX2969124.1 ABC transporter permease [Streptomyces sp. JHD 1]